MRAERARSGVAGKEELSPEQEAQLRADVQYATAADQCTMGSTPGHDG